MMCDCVTGCCTEFVPENARQLVVDKAWGSWHKAENSRVSNFKQTLIAHSSKRAKQKQQRWYISDMSAS